MCLILSKVCPTKIGIKEILQHFRHQKSLLLLLLSRRQITRMLTHPTNFVKNEEIIPFLPSPTRLALLGGGFIGVKSARTAWIFQKINVVLFFNWCPKNKHCKREYLSSHLCLL